MRPLPVAAVASVVLPAEDEPRPLSADVRAAVPEAPRRLNRLIQLGLLGAHRAVSGRTLPPDTPVFVSFSHGSIGDSQSLVMSTAQGRPPMPVTFINVSSNMASFHIAGTLGLDSPNFVVASRDLNWPATLQLASLDANRRRCTLVGAVEECAWPLDQHRARLGVAPGTTLLESSQWLLIDESEPHPRAVIRWVRRFQGAQGLSAVLRGADLPARLQWTAGAGFDAAPPDLLDVPEWRDGSAPSGYSGVRAAETCCRFIEGADRGALLHLSRNERGGGYALLVEKPD